MNWSRWRSIPWVDTRARFVASVKPGGKLLDLGSSDGGTLRHFAELRPDLSFASADIAGLPETYPRGTDFRRANFDTDRLPWPDGSFDAVTCMHVVEHLQNPQHILSEAARVLKPDGLLYVETPHPKSVSLRSAVGHGTEQVTVNFYDDPTHFGRPHSPQSLYRLFRMYSADVLECRYNIVLRTRLLLPWYLFRSMVQRDAATLENAVWYGIGFAVYAIGRKAAATTSARSYVLSGTATA